MNRVKGDSWTSVQEKGAKFSVKSKNGSFQASFEQ